eukprot:gene21874-28316_t
MFSFVVVIGNIPIIIPTLQKQQGYLRYFCNSKTIPIESIHSKPLQFLNNAAIKDIEFVASKSYQASGVITVTIIFQDTIFVAIQDGTKENPLLDSKFPNISGKGRGYQIFTYDNGIEGWPSLRRVSIWQTIGSLEEEFRQKVNSNVSQTLKSSTTSSTPNDSKTHIDRKESTITSELHTTDFDLLEKAESKENNATSFRKVSTNDMALSHDLRSLTIDEEDNDVDISSNHDITNNKPLSNLSSTVSRPHHIPKNDALSKRLDELRKNLGDQGIVAPWDTKGRPLASLTNKK